MTLTDGVRVRMRTAEFVHPDGGASFQADVLVRADKADDESGISAAIAALNDPTDKKAARSTHRP